MTPGFLGRSTWKKGVSPYWDGDEVENQRLRFGYLIFEILVESRSWGETSKGKVADREEEHQQGLEA